MLSFPLPPTFSPPSLLPPTSPPLHLYAFFMHGGGPRSPKGYRLPGLLLLDPAGWSAGLREMVRLLGLALKRVCFIGSVCPAGLPACCGLASLRALEDHRQRQASPGLFDMYIHEHKTHSTSPSLCKLSGIWFSFWCSVCQRDLFRSRQGPLLFCVAGEGRSAADLL